MKRTHAFLPVAALPFAALAVSAAEPPPAASQEGVRLWEGGPQWADRNVGAEEPWENGHHFWWGDVLGSRREKGDWVASDDPSRRRGFDWFPEITPTYGKSADTLQGEGWTTADDVLAPEHDAARVRWGGSWRMPTSPELEALCEQCDWTWTATNGVNGFVVRGRGEFASASIFLPFTGWAIESRWEFRDAGFLWASDPRADMPASWRLKFSPRGRHDPRPRCCVGYHWDRFVTMPVRPVRDGSD